MLQVVRIRRLLRTLIAQWCIVMVLNTVPGLATPDTVFTFSDIPTPTAGVTDDQFDFSQGARTYNNGSASSATYSDGDSLRAALGSDMSGVNVEGANLIFANNAAATRYIYFKTASMITLTNYQLRVAHDGASPYNRSLDFVRLWGSSDNITWIDYGSTNVAVAYSDNAGVTGNQLLISADVSNAGAAQFYRLEVRNYTTPGVRIRELDGCGIDRGTGERLVRDPIVFNSSDNGPTTDVYDEDPGFVTNMTSTALYNAGENVREAFGAANGSGVENGTIIFSDSGTVDNGNQVVGDGGETVDYLEWDMTSDLPASLAGVRLNIAGGLRPVELIRFSIDGNPVTLSNGSTVYDNDSTGSALDLMFQSPRAVTSGSTCRLELTRSNLGPRVREVDALLQYGAQNNGLFFMIR